MDISFPSRRRRAPIDLPALLARTSAVQGASPTARAQVRMDAGAVPPAAADPHVSLFAEGAAPAPVTDHGASFADLSDAVFSPRQSN